MTAPDVTAGPEDLDSVGHAVRIRALRGSDYGWLFDLATSQPLLGRWRLRGAAPSPEEFPAQIWQDVFTQIVIESIDGAPVGLVTAYGADPRNGLARVALLLDPRMQRRGWPLEGAALFLDHLFTHWPIRKVYVEGPRPIMEELGLGRDGVSSAFRLEGVLIEHERYDGVHVDLLIYGLTAEAFHERIGARLAKTVVQA